MYRNRFKSVFLWIGVTAPVVGSYIATNSTAAIGGNSYIDHAIVWVCGLISIIAAINNPTRKGGL